jgi:hypothetical protein
MKINHTYRNKTCTDTHTCRSWSWEKLAGRPSLKLLLEILTYWSCESVVISAGTGPVKLLQSREMVTRFVRRPNSGDKVPVRFILDKFKPTTMLKEEEEEEEEGFPHVTPVHRHGSLVEAFTTTFQSPRWFCGSVMVALRATSARASSFEPALSCKREKTWVRRTRINNWPKLLLSFIIIPSTILSLSSSGLNLGSTLEAQKLLILRNNSRALNDLTAGGQLSMVIQNP